MRVAVAFVALAALAAGWFGFAWLDAARGEEATYATERDAVLRAAGGGLGSLHTVSHRRAEADVDRWLAVTAGSLHADLRADRDAQVEQVREARTVAAAKVLRAAVVELDAAAGSARVIAVLDVRLAGEEPQRRRINADLARSPQGWRITGVEAAS